MREQLGAWNDRPTISIRQLIESGVLDSPEYRTVGFVYGRVEIVVMAKHGQPDITVSWKFRDEYFMQFAMLEFEKTTLGERCYFKCPDGGKRSRELFLVEGKFRSRLKKDALLGGRPPLAQRNRAAFHKRLQRLQGSDGRGPARGENRKRLLEQLKPDGWMRVAAYQTADALDAERAKLDTEKRRATRSSRRGEKAAFDDGFTDSVRVIIPSDDARDWVKLLADDRKRTGTRVRKLPVAASEEFPVLMASAVDDQKMFRPGVVTARTLGWLSYDPLIIECHLEMAEQAFLLIRSRYGGGEQIIHLSRSPNGNRWYLVCPLAKTRHDMLYLRDGVFASAKANRLVHASQRKA